VSSSIPFLFVFVSCRTVFVVFLLHRLMKSDLLSVVTRAVADALQSSFRAA